ncbi:MAG TPA: hypothetical protein VEJ63_16975 [Planctomycetota bacterium]|nr:hypothetical protein [Planctomycetota bacterium]
MSALESVFDLGYASEYFITDPNRGIAQMSSPAAITSFDEFTLDVLATSLGELALVSEKGRWPWSKTEPAKPLGHEKAMAGLLDVIASGQSAVPLFLDRPLLVLTRGLNQNALAPLLLFKMRGHFQTLALDFSNREPSELFELSVELQKASPCQIISESLFVWPCVEKLNILSGQGRSAVSMTLEPAALQAKHPEIGRSA